jgi:hypothetical protein
MRYAVDCGTEGVQQNQSFSIAYLAFFVEIIDLLNKIFRARAVHFIPLVVVCSNFSLEDFELFQNLN